MAPFVREMRAMDYRFLGYIDEFLLTPAPMVVAEMASDCVEARKKISRHMQRLGIKRHPIKGEREGSTHVKHRKMVVDYETITFYVMSSKAARVEQMEKALLREVVINIR